MDSEQYKTSGSYATVDGKEYLCRRRGDHVMLFSNDDPLPSGFKVSPKSWVRGERRIPLSDVQRLIRVQICCRWRGYPFALRTVKDGLADVHYEGKAFAAVSSLEGMTRPDKYEVLGKVPVSELTEIERFVEELPLNSTLHGHEEV